MALIEADLALAESMASAASGTSWRCSPADELRVEVVQPGGHISTLRLMRDQGDASAGDVLFVGNSRDDLHYLVDVLRHGERPSSSTLREIERGCARASERPWVSFNEDPGGQSVIWITDEDHEPDLYLYLDDEVAPGVDSDFVAYARQAIPLLLAECYARLAVPGPWRAMPS